MNNQRRKILKQIHDDLSPAVDQIDVVLGDEQDAYDSLPESLQYSERGLSMEEAISNLEQAKISLEEALEGLETAREN